MRAVRRRGILEVVHCGRGPSSRVRARVSPVQHLFRGGHKCDIHMFQGGQRCHERFGVPEEETADGGAVGSNRRRAGPGDVTFGHTLR